MAIVYRHRRLDTNEIFYVGIGKELKRAYNKCKRSNWWKKINNKTEISVEILADNLTYDDAKELEIFLIELYGRKDLGTGPLVNMTDGGDGAQGYKHTEENKDKMGKMFKEQYKNGRVSSFKGKRHSDEWKENFSKNHPKPFLGIKRKEHSNKMKGERNYLSDIILNLETGIYYFGIREASNSVTHLSFFNVKDNINKNKKNKTNFIKTTE